MIKFKNKINKTKEKINKINNKIKMKEKILLKHEIGNTIQSLINIPENLEDDISFVKDYKQICPNENSISIGYLDEKSDYTMGVFLDLKENALIFEENYKAGGFKNEVEYLNTKLDKKKIIEIMKENYFNTIDKIVYDEFINYFGGSLEDFKGSVTLFKTNKGISEGKLTGSYKVNEGEILIGIEVDNNKIFVNFDSIENIDGYNYKNLQKNIQIHFKDNSNIGEDYKLFENTDDIKEVKDYIESYILDKYNVTTIGAKEVLLESIINNISLDAYAPHDDGLEMLELPGRSKQFNIKEII